MEPEGSLPHSQVPATCPNLSQLDPVYTPTLNFLKIHLKRMPPPRYFFYLRIFCGGRGVTDMKKGKYKKWNAIFLSDVWLTMHRNSVWIRKTN